MELCPYLHAIQKVAGRTIKEKHQTLYHLAEKIISDCENQNRTIEVHPSEELAEPLVPFVELIIAKTLKKPEGIIKALKSDDWIIFNAALKAKWFFNGSIKNHPDVHHFREDIFPYISVLHRLKLIKTLASRLTPGQFGISEEFYLIVREMYGEHHARPFLNNCSEFFIENIIVNNQITFYEKELTYLLQHNPNVVVKYFKLCASNDKLHKKSSYPALKTYKDFLPRLLKKTLYKDFIELVEMHEASPLDIKLSRTCTLILLKNEIDKLMENPRLFMPMLSLKIAIETLGRAKFEAIFEKLFPRNIEEFKFKHYYHYLEYIPQDQKIPLMLSTFQQVYKVSLLDCDSKVTPAVLKALPPPERIKQARKKLEADKNWYVENGKSSFDKFWVCYLPIEESIPAIKKLISKTIEDFNRICLVNQMIYSCKINNDMKALLEVLKYAVIQHKDEDGWTLLEFLERLLIDYEMQNLPQEHWEVLDKFLDCLHDEKKIDDYETPFQNILIKGIHYSLINNLPIAKKVDLLSQGNIEGRKAEWNILRENPKFEKLCIEEFMKSIPRVYPKIHENNIYSWPETIYFLVTAIYDFNKRNSKTKNGVGNIWIKSNPLFSDEVRKLVSGQISSQKYFPKIKQLRLLLEINEPDLYDLWIGEEYNQTGANANEVLRLLKKDPQIILDNWEHYYGICKRNICRKQGRLFMYNSQWFQDLPVKFIEKCLKEIIEDKDNLSVIVLASLIKGPNFEKFIKTLAPNFIEFDDTEDGTKKHLTRLSIVQSLRAMRPQPSLDFVLQLCEGNDTKIIEKCLITLGRTMSVDKLLVFHREVIIRQMSITKPSIILFHEVATKSQLREIYMDLWSNRQGKPSRLFLLKNILDIFKKQPCLETWNIVKECFDSLTVKDRKVIKYIRVYDRIHPDFIANYIEQLINVFEKIGDTENSFGSVGVWCNITDLLQDLPENLAGLFSEKQHEKIIRTYLTNLSLPKELLWAAQRYLTDCYILPAKDKFDTRLKLFLDLFVKMLQNEWNFYRSDDPLSSYPAHYFVGRLITNIVYNSFSAEQSKLINATLDAFVSVLQPQDAPEFYCKFTFAILHDDKTTPREFGQKISKIVSSLTDTFSTALTGLIAKYLFDIMLYYYHKFKADGHLDIIESLLESDNDDATLLAAYFLLWQNWDLKNSTRFWKIVEVLRKNENSAVASCANLATIGYRL